MASRHRAAAELARPATCGPFKSIDFQRAGRPLLADRLRVRFPRGGDPGGGRDAGNIRLERGAASLIIGARETHARADADFAGHAALAATFGGKYEAATIVGRDGAETVIAGFVRERDGESAVAHGWFVDANGDVLDVAVFLSGPKLDPIACRHFAQVLLAGVTQGPRTLKYGTGKPTLVEVSYAKFQLTLPSDWIISDTEGIHDYARMSLRRQAVFPGLSTSLSLALDSHPGDWASPGSLDGERSGGHLLGLPVVWHLTKADGIAGAWTISGGLRSRDHAVASIAAGSDAERDAAIAFAESITVAP